jgi:hypothetical protein
LLRSSRERENTTGERPAAAARLRAEAEQRARLEAERLERERQRAERAARESAESAQRAELVLLQNAQRADFERAESLARASAELQSELDGERAARRALESSLTSQLLRQRLLTSASMALCVGGVLAALGIYFGALQPYTERRIATAERSLLTERNARNQAQQEEARTRLRADELSATVSSLRQTLQEREQRGAPAPVPSTVRKLPAIRTAEPPPSVKPCRDDGDPLNPCLKR